MKSFFRFFAERHTLAYIITFSIILLGVISSLTIKRDMYPSVDFGEVVITTNYPGASPEDVELNVTNKLEDELDTVTGIDTMISTSKENFSMIHLKLDPDASDEDEVKRNIRNAVDRVNDLPSEVDEAPLVTEIDVSIFPVMEVGLYGDIPYPKLRKLAHLLENKLKALDGIARVEAKGYYDREVLIEADPDKLRYYDLSLNDLVNAIKERSIRGTSGVLDTPFDQKTIVTHAQFKEPKDVESLVVRSNFGGQVIRIRQVADVVDGFEEPETYHRIDGQDTISFVVYKTESADIIRTVNSVKELIKTHETTLPDDVSVLISDDFSYYVKNRLNVVMSNGLLGLFFVVLVLTVFLNFRSAIWVAMGIPVTVMGVITMLPLLGSHLDVITLLAVIIVMGIIVDDAIIISENIAKRREMGDSPEDAAVNGLSEVIKPVLTTILTTFLAFAPMFFMSGVMGKFVWVIPLVITLALMFSLIEGVTALPSHMVPGLRRIKPHSHSDEPHWYEVLRERFYHWIRGALNFRYFIVTGFIVILVGCLGYAAKYMDFVLFPSDVADQFMVTVELEKGSSLDITAEKLRPIEALLSALPEGEVSSFRTEIGKFGERHNEFVEPNGAMVYVNLTPFATRDRMAQDIVAALRLETDKFEGYKSIKYAIEGGGPPVGKPITLRVVGSDDDQRDRLTSDVMTYLATLDGVKDLDRDDKLGKEQILFKLDYEALPRFGLSVAQVLSSVRTAFEGSIATSVRYGEDDVDFRVRLNEEARGSMETLKTLYIPNNTNRLIPFNKIARIDVQPGSPDYRHYDTQRTTTVTGDVEKGVSTPLVVIDKVLAHFNLQQDYPGMRFVVGGEGEETKKSMQDLFRTFILAAIGIYCLLLLLFNSLTQPFMVMLAIPFGLSGVIVAFALHGETLGFISMLGIIGLSGVVVNDSLVLVHHLNNLLKTSGDRPFLDVVAQASSDRLRAIVVTSLSTVAGLLPMAYGIGGSDPFIAPMALALGYGLVLATPLTLILIPCLYAIGRDIRVFTRQLCGLKDSK